MPIEVELGLKNPFLKKPKRDTEKNDDLEAHNQPGCFNCCKRFFHYKKECIKLYLIVIILLLQFFNLVYSRLDFDVLNNFQNTMLKKIISKITRNNLPSSTSGEFESEIFETTTEPFIYG